MKRVYKLENLDCAHCAAKIEAAVGKMDGIESVHVNFLTQKMTLEVDEAKLEALVPAMEAAAKKVDDAIVMKRA